MVSAVTQTSHRALPSSAKTARKRSSRALLHGLVATGVGAATVCWIVGTLATMHSLTSATASGDRGRFETRLALNPIVRADAGERRIRPAKFSRAPLPLVDQIAQSGLTGDAIRSSRERMAVVARLMPDKAHAAKANGLTADAIRAFHTKSMMVASIAPQPERTAEPARAVAALTRGKDDAILAAATAKAAAQPVLASALVEPSAATGDTLPKPFSYVMAEREATAAAAAESLPDSIPLPIAKPELRVALAKPEPDERKPAKPTELAYAKPQSALEEDDGSDRSPMPTFQRRRGGKIAYYDISAGVVHMPNGEKLEAHSGIGEMRDNPKYTHVTMRGPTPPGTYKLSMRESLFHGVAAIRLTPTNGIAPKGRVGLLAHSYLLRRRGDSHGCVAFADYKRFLRAFQSGQVDTMIIVPKMSAWGGLTASADDRKSGGIASERRVR